MKKILVLFSILASIFIGILMPLSVTALDPLDNELTCQRTPEAAVCEENEERSSGNPIFGPGSLLASVFIWLTRIIGAISVIMVIIGGFKYVLSNGDANGIQSAKNTILYAIVGLLVAGFAGLIIRFVIGRVGGT